MEMYNQIVYFKPHPQPHPFNCEKIGRVQLSSNFFYCYHCYQIELRDLGVYGYLERKATPSGMSCPLCIKTKMKKTKVLEATTGRCSIENVPLEMFTKFTGEHLCQRSFFNKVAGLTKLLKMPFLTKHLPVTSSKV